MSGSACVALTVNTTATRRKKIRTIDGSIRCPSENATACTYPGIPRFEYREYRKTLEIQRFSPRSCVRLLADRCENLEGIGKIPGNPLSSHRGFNRLPMSLQQCATPPPNIARLQLAVSAAPTATHDSPFLASWSLRCN